MQQALEGLKQSASLKAFAIGILILVLLIPVSMIKGVVRDRIHVHNEARTDITQSWGGEQIISGPILVLPYRVEHRNTYGNVVVETDHAYILPSRLDVDIEVDPEVRARGIHEVPIYSANVHLSGTFSSPQLENLKPSANDIQWQKAFVALSVSDARAIAHAPLIDIAGSMSRFKPGGERILADTTPPIVAAIEASLDSYRDGDELRFEMDLQLNGADALQVSALGDSTRVKMSSTWPSPSFIGNYLPENREVSDAGFSADWRISNLGRPLPSQWDDRNTSVTGATQSAFGVAFYQPVDLYQLSLRATKYAVLFIGMTFIAYFLFEVMLRLQLHPLQYLLVGFANALFYLLLLSLSEHVGFGWAYLGSALASTALVAGYSATILVRRSRGLLMAAALVALYGFLYMMLQAETYALLAGAAGLWVTLAAIMYLTRKIDWYNQGRGGRG